MPDHILENGDSPELEELFNSIAHQVQDTTAAEQAQPAAPAVESPATPAATAPIDPSQVDPVIMYEQIGQLTRKLHDAMQSMGYDKSLESMVELLPDAKDRLTYIATLTETAAERVLNATDIAKPIQDGLETQADALAKRWNMVFANQMSVGDFKQLAEETRSFLTTVPEQTQATSTQLLEIVMAQDFQDLTGQVIKKMMDMFKGIEHELVSFLIAYSPTVKHVQVDTSLLNGPVVNPEGRTDVVTSQQQVDDLLESLGF
ncbi:chemotaxis phosphatase CheZ [Paludibacterium purpuratum]|uniref:Protein phosphatase CheZ n=1 Tax=Paludibacterium purpuratum TaxID=1144873 RepID=A0A4R7AXJ8_9NEIS|nr:chemotaxis phosphatase CheZ [Paludibacterium purpuratum]